MTGLAAHVDAPRSPFEVAGDAPMVDDVLVYVWEGLAAHRVVECPVCGGSMYPEYGARARPIGGSCESCGSALS